MNTKHQNFIIIAILLLSNSILAQPVPPGVDMFRLFDNERRTPERFEDVYHRTDGGYFVCGSSNNQTWLMRLNENGNPIWSSIRDSENSDAYYSVIETDDGNALVGGRVANMFSAVLINSGDGNTIWQRNYVGGTCQSVIELKSGEFALAGYNSQVPRRAYMTMITNAGVPIWELYYEVQDESARFMNMRETDGGIVVVGYAWSPVIGILLKVDFEGNIIWARDLEGTLPSIVSDGRGGFAIGGWSSIRDRSVFELTLVDSRGENQNQTGYPTNARILDVLNCINRLSDNGYIMVGRRCDAGPPSYYTLRMLRTNSNGEALWSEHFEDMIGERFPGVMYEIKSVIVQDRDRIVACGEFYGGGLTGSDAFLMRLFPDRPGVYIFYKSPEDSLLNTLAGTSLEFCVRARSRGGFEMNYRWLCEGAEIGNDSSSTAIIRFNQVDDIPVLCRVSDEDAAYEVGWLVKVLNMFIFSHTPDTLNLTLQRGTRVDFGIDSVAYVDGLGVPSYAWRLFDAEAEQWDSVGTDSAVSILFDRTGRFGVEAVAYIDEATDTVHWNVNVRGVIRSFNPSSESLTVTPGSSVTFELDPFNPQPDSLTYRWTFDGDELAGDSARLSLRFDIIGRYEIVGYAFEGVESDSQRWIVNVARPDGVDVFGIKNYDLRLGLSPNPFNSITDVQFNLPNISDVSLRLYDINGREVWTLLDEKARPAGSYTMALDGRNLPAGLYFARLVAGGEVKTAKVLLIR